MSLDRSIAADALGNPHPIGGQGHPAMPLPTTSLIGREKAIRGVVELLLTSNARLVTLTGPGGTGKIRLALAVAQLVAGDVAFVPLAEVADPALTDVTIAQTLGIEQTPNRPVREALRDALHARRLLLVLDNFEHLVANTSIVSELLQTCPRLKLLVTSRVRLMLSGEHVFPVEPLAILDVGHQTDLAAITASSGARLFVDRARAVQPAFELTESNAAAVASICRHLDGIPLAIELAAARSNLLSAHALAARLEHRLDLLSGGPRDAPTRHQTMRAAVAWSSDLLSDTERMFWERLSVFVGSFTAEAAEAVGRLPQSGEFDPLATLESLIDQGLLRPIVNIEGSPRFIMLETAREYARKQLDARGTADETRDAHAAFFLELAQAAEPGLMGTSPEAWFNQVEADIANIRAALGWLRDRDQTQMALQLAGALAWFWTAPNYIAEGRYWYESLIERSEGQVDAEILEGVHGSWGSRRLACRHGASDRTPGACPGAVAYRPKYARSRCHTPQSRQHGNRCVRFRSGRVDAQ